MLDHFVKMKKIYCKTIKAKEISDDHCLEFKSKKVQCKNSYLNEIPECPNEIINNFIASNNA